MVVDSSGAALAEIVQAGGVWLIKPNVAELRELLGRKVADAPEALIAAAGNLGGKVENVLVSRGSKGAIFAKRDVAWVGKCSTAARKVQTTVACGDYLLAGVLKGLSDGRRESTALRMGIKAATARAWGLAGRKQWRAIEREIKVSVGE